MQNFYLFFELGFQHLISWYAYDHILFLFALCGTYLLSDWKRVLILVTAFTIGHSVTLALSVFNKIIVPTAWIEFLIPITIIVTTIINIARKRKFNKNVNPAYFLALSFGLIHGLGFSNYLKSLLSNEEAIFTKLLAFNLGLEISQLILVIIILIISFVLLSIIRIQKREWHLFLSSAILGIAVVLALQRMPSF